MDQQPTSSQRWRQFMITLVVVVVVQQVAGYLLWHDPLTNRVGIAIASGIGAAACLDFARRRG